MQFFSNDCSSFFTCTSMTEMDSAVGCYKECGGEGERVNYPGPNDFGLAKVRCVPEEEASFACAGALEFGCPGGGFEVGCNCEGELWIDATCSRAFLCTGQQEESGENPGVHFNLYRAASK